MKKKYQPTYWNKKGKYQDDFDRLYKELVPEFGESDTLNGEILRISSYLYYDFFNNGGCNSWDSYTDGAGDEIKYIDPYYSEMLDKMISLGITNAQTIKNLLLSEEINDREETFKIYDRFMDSCVKYVLKH